MNEEWGTEEARRRWDLHAEEIASLYTPLGDLSREVLLNPVLLDVLGNVQGLRVLDAGCGEGYLSRILTRRGASVVAMDYSRSMLQIARDRAPSNLAVEYRHGNLEDLLFFGEGSFDIVVANMVLMDLSDYEAAIKEAHRVLLPGGVFVFSILHPCFSAPASGWVRDETGERRYWKVDRYFDEAVFEQRWPPTTEHGVLQFHRTLTSYFRAVVAAGFVVETLVEPKPSDEMLRKYPDFTDDLRVCHFLVFKVRKQAD